MKVPQHLIDEAAALGIVEGAVIRSALSNDATVVHDPSAWREHSDGHIDNGTNGPGSSLFIKLNDTWAKVIAPAPTTADPINPAHYKGAVETIDYPKDKLSPEEYRGFLKGNAMKYLSRAEKKGGKEDYKKALWYVTKLADL